MSKYKNIKVNIDGIKFDSKKECLRYSDLKILEKAGEIKNLELQKRFDLLPTIQNSNRALSKVSYVCDFFYFDVRIGKNVVEDVKGLKTAIYNLKKHLFIEKYGHEYVFFENGKEKLYYDLTR